MQNQFKWIYSFSLLFVFLFNNMNTYSYEPEHFDVIVDCDVAQDDWSSVLYVLNQKERSNLLGLSAVGSGEAHCEPAKKILSNLVYLAGRENDNIPITCGDSVPMDGFHTWPNLWRYNSDTLNDIRIADNPNPNILSTHTVEWMKETLLKNPRPVVIIALGPLTNIGQLVQKYPEAAAKIKRLYIMGGAFRVKGNLVVKDFSETLQNKFAEWNIWIDPLAAHIVFNSQIPLTVVPLDATNRVQVTREFADKIKSSAKSKTAKFYSEVLDKNLWFIDSGEFYFWDVLATTSVYEPICKTEDHVLDVVVKYDPLATGLSQFESFGPTFSEVYNQFADYMVGRRAFEQLETGRTIIKSELDFAAQNNGRQKICIEANKELFMQTFIEVINR